jgi:deoxyribonuclease (pyrimidine dimer)
VTRINCVPPRELCDQHLLAETRELPRVPRAVLAGRYSLASMPERYTLGTGHVRFFYNKLGYLAFRYQNLFDECKARGFKVKWAFPPNLFPVALCNDWKPDEEAMALNRSRIHARMANFTPRYTETTNV